MGYHSFSLLFLIFVCTLKFCVGQYAVPNIEFEAFTPKGLKISIPADKGVELFGFHGKLNKPILQIEPGEFSEDVTRAVDGKFTYFNPSIKLKEGDNINYWVFIQHDQLGFRKDDQTWKVDKLNPNDPTGNNNNVCGNSITKVLGRANICSGDEIVNYKFTESIIDPQFWQLEQYIPSGPDYEYVIYKNEPDVIGIENNVLRIKPKVVEENIMSAIVIEGCTRPSNSLDCSRPFQGIIQNPIVSGKIVSKVAFCFAEVSIRAKLPQGDWIFPEIYLEDVNDPQNRILLAFTRGNKELNDGEKEIGGKMLMGGPYLVYNQINKNPVRKYLVSHIGQAHIGNDWHTFTVKWTNDRMDLLIDDINYGVINADALQATGFNKETMVRLVIGVGAGGAHNFPDSSMSGPHAKPWKSKGRYAVKTFLQDKANWQKTWNADTQLLVEFITVKAL